MTLSVVIPARNEEDNIEETLLSLKNYLRPGESEIIVVNDHSTDATERVVRKVMEKSSIVKLVENKKHPGFANALATGFENASGAFVLPIMADSCDDPQTIQDMLSKLKDGYDLICGSRYMKGGGKAGGPKIQGFFSWFVGKSLHFLINIPTSDVSNAYKMYRKSILDTLTLKEKGFAVSMEATLKFYFTGAGITEVPTIWYGRKKGESKFKLSKTFPYVRLYLNAIRKKWTYR